MSKNSDSGHMNEVKYWQDVENKVLDPEVLKSEFQDNELDFNISSSVKGRRDFLKIMGFSFGAVSASSCMRIPVQRAIPYVYKNPTVVPGVANWYATAMDPRIGETLLVKTREGRPIKIEGNTFSSIYQGGTSPYAQASVLSLYDSSRFKGPTEAGKSSNWEIIDKNIQNKLDSINSSGKKIVLITPPMTSPSLSTIITDLKNHYTNFSHVTFENAGTSALVTAHSQLFDFNNLPTFKMNESDYVLSFGADFLGTWIAPTAFTKQYTQKRDVLVHKTILKHVQIEERMSLTGSNADYRFTLDVNKQKALLLGILSALQRKSGKQVLPAGQQLPSFDQSLAQQLANDLYQNRGKSLLLCGINDIPTQSIVASINDLLGNYGKTIELYENKYSSYSSDKDFENLITDMQNGEVGALLNWDVNYIHNYFDTQRIESAVEKVGLKIAYSTFPDETSQKCDYILPSNYFLESWGDYYNGAGELSFCQPVIQPLFSTRMFGESLLRLLGKKDYHNYLKDFVKDEFFNKQSKYLSSLDLWNHGVHDGVVKMNGQTVNASLNKEKLFIAFSKLTKSLTNDNEFSLTLYQKVGLRTGEFINNPWLQEMPDPITKATWDNYVLISPKTAKSMGIKTGTFVEVSHNGKKLSLPAILQAGMAPKTIAIAIGYGRKVSGKVGKDLGGNASIFSDFVRDSFQNTLGGVSVKKTLDFKTMALTQTHHSMEGRDIVRETTVKEYTQNPKSGNKESIKLISMWSGHKNKEEQWAMAIDLSKCTGCSGCIVSCNAENNVPVVGREEVKNRREMHWLRIDRYYKGNEDQPEVVHQPVMCQHCDNAPCETVCPVLATVQSSDGLNQQVYNRCVGTRYCANNCPYKVRRFNWFDYPHKDPNENQVLNPDVVVRSRGVMEKCSMCIQRIQEGRLSAKKSGKKLADGDIKLACQQSCPGDAIVFGDLNDPNSRISKLLKHPRNYRLLEEINIQPRVSYLTKVRNKD